MVVAYDPGINCSGVQSITFNQYDKTWDFIVQSTRNVTILLYPSLDTGEVNVSILDSQGNAANVTFYYSKLSKPDYLHELFIVFSIVFILFSAVMLLFLRGV